MAVGIVTVLVKVVPVVVTEAVVIDYLLGVLMFVLWIADMFFPLWLVKLYTFGRQKRWSRARSWLVASSLVYLFICIVANLVGWNIGMYALMIPTFFLVDGVNHLVAFEYDTVNLWVFCNVSFSWFVLFPAGILGLYEKKLEERNA